MNTKDPMTAKFELVLDALKYAHSNNLNINHVEGVKKILEALGAKGEDPEEFMDLLQNADAFMDMKASETEIKKTDLSN